MTTTTSDSRRILFREGVFDRERSVCPTSAVVAPLHGAETNRNIRMAVKRFGLSDLETETRDFLCGCGDDGSERRITLTPAEYEALRENDEPILSEGHTVGNVREDGG